MKTMIWKELRENFKWALLALLVLTLAELYTLSSERVNPSDSSMTLCSSAFLLVTSFGCSAIGAALAVVQILPELQRDRWAALLHRPVSRSVIFLGKVLTGLLLYFFATTLPFLASAAYVATPGQFAAPLVPGMMLPGLSDLFLGPVFYFAALLLCLQRGRWFGNRGLIGLSVLPVFLMHLTMGWPFLLPLLASPILLLAAWGTMLGNGQVQERPLAGWIAFVLLVLAGAEMAWLMLIFGLQFLPGKNSSLFTYTYFRITQDGQVFLLTQKGDGAAPVLTDTNGKVITDERYVGNRATQGFLQLLPLTFSVRNDFFPRESYLSGQPRDLGNYVAGVRQGYQSKETWYLLVRQNYFIGYDKLSRRCVGIFDREGFKPPGAVPNPFPLPLKAGVLPFSNPLLYWSGPQLYAFDLPERSMTRFFNARNETIYGALDVFDLQNIDKPPPVAVALANEVRIFDPQGKPLMTLPYNHDAVLWSELLLARNAASNRFYLQYEPSRFWRQSSTPEVRPTRVFLDEIDLQGKVLHTYSLPFTDIFSLLFSQPTRWEVLFSTYSSPFLPALFGTIHQYLFPAAEPTIRFDMMMSYPQPSYDVSIMDLAILFIIDFALAVFAFRWARLADFSKDRAWKWATFVFLFGPAGLLTFRLASNWPVRVQCPECKRWRPAHETNCPHCQAGWPEPKREGTEIFDEESIVSKTAVPVG